MTRLPIYVGRELVGALRCTKKPAGRVYTLPYEVHEESEDPTSFAGRTHFEYLAIRLTSRHVEVDNFVMASAVAREAALAGALDAAGYAWPDIPLEEIRVPVKDATRYAWIVGEVDPAIAEVLFDLDVFEPWGRPDADAAAERRWWVEHDGISGFHSGGIVASTIPASAIMSGSIAAEKIAVRTITAEETLVRDLRATWPSVATLPVNGAHPSVTIMDELAKVDWTAAGKAIKAPAWVKPRLAAGSAS